MSWHIEFEGEVYRDADLTLGQCERLEELTGRSWLNIHPIRYAKDALAVLTVVVADRTGQPVDTLRTRLASLRADEVIDLMKIPTETDDRPTEYVDGNPQPADEPSTPT